jgi:hypothetical protein
MAATTMNPHLSLHFKYHIPVWRPLSCAVVCLAFAILMAFVANSNRKGLRLFHLVTFSPSTATGIFWVFVLILVLGFLIFALLVFRSLKGPIVVALEDTLIILPRNSLKDELLAIPYSSIYKITVHQNSSQHYLTLYSPVGQGRVVSTGFQNPTEFIQFEQGLSSRVNL